MHSVPDLDALLIAVLTDRLTDADRRALALLLAWLRRALADDYSTTSMSM